MLRAIQELKKYENASDEEIRDMQLRKLSSLLQHHMKNPLYREICNSKSKNIKHVSLEDMANLPVVTKKFLREYFDEKSANEHAFRHNSTSGSTGSNLRFYQCRKMLDTASAAVWYGTNLTGVNSWGDRQIGIWGNSPPSSFKMKLEIYAKRTLSNEMILQGFAVDAKKVSTPKVDAIICSGEQSQIHQHQTIEEYFGQKLYNRYGSREFSGIAFETIEHIGMYVPPVRFILETDKNGELLVTDLDNYATPFIRYAIGDAVTLGNARDHLGKGGQCIIEIHGRTHDIVSTPSGKHIMGQFLTILARKVPGILEFQYEQIDSYHLLLLAVTTDEYDPRLECVLTKHFDQYFGDEMTLSISKTDKIKRTAMGKRRFIIRREKFDGNK